MQINSTAGAHYLPLFGASAPVGLAERQVDLFTAPVTSISAFLPLLRETWPVPANSDVININNDTDASAGLSYEDWLRETEEYQNAAEADAANGPDESQASASDEGAAEAAATDTASDDAAAEAAADETAADQTADASGGTSSGGTSSGGGGLLGGLFGWQ